VPGSISVFGANHWHSCELYSGSVCDKYIYLQFVKSMSQVSTGSSRPSTRSALLASRTLAMRDSSRTVSLEIDPDTAAQERKYPSIRDYYQSQVLDDSKPIQLQHGLSNYSSLVLGDDRIAFSESILSATYRVAVEEKLSIESPSKSKSNKSRRRDYEEAQLKVGEAEMNRLEKVMKDKLIQRSAITSSPFQVRKAFKFFDQGGLMVLAIEGFTRALEFLGFQFSELQNVALFGKYDTECNGDIDYMNFIKTAMFYAPNYNGQDFRREAPRVVIVDPILTPAELEVKRIEIRTLFNKLDKTQRYPLMLGFYYQVIDLFLKNFVVYHSVELVEISSI
jgi:hypothetical protein